jgi:hypothetical protein
MAILSYGMIFRRFLILAGATLTAGGQIIKPKPPIVLVSNVL